MRMSMGVGPFRFYSGGQLRKPPVPVASSYFDSTSSNHGSSAALAIGIAIILVQGLQWLLWLSA
jgi:hypothetical protein